MYSRVYLHISYMNTILLQLDRLFLGVLTTTCPHIFYIWPELPCIRQEKTTETQLMHFVLFLYLFVIWL